MAEEDPTKKTEDAAQETKPKKQFGKGDSGDLFAGDDLMDVFTNERDEINEELATLAASLPDVATVDLIAFARDVRGIQ